MRFGLGDDPIISTTVTSAPADVDSFQAFLLANPAYAEQYAAANAANPGDPALRMVVYNPVTGVYGPAPLGYGAQATTAGATVAGVPSYVWILGIGVMAAVLMASGKGRR